MRIGIVTVCIALLVSIAGCGSSGGSGGSSGSSGIGAGSSSLGNITASTVTGVNSVYVTKIDGTTNSSSAISSQSSSGSFVETLAYISNTGNNDPVVFQTSEGKKVILNITSVKAIKESFIAITFDAMIEFQAQNLDSGGKSYTFTAREAVSGKALVDMNNSKVYNLSDYDIQNVLIDNNYIYITRNSSKDLYKIAFNDISHAIPLNNGNYTPAGTLYYIINNRVVASDHSFDVNGATIPKALTSVLLTSSQSTMTAAFSTAIELTDTRGNPPYIVDNAGNIWGYRFERNGKFAKFQVSLDNNGNTIVSNYEEFTLGVPFSTWTHFFVINGSGNHADHLTIGDQSYYYVKRNADSGIAFHAGLSTFGNSFPGWAGECATYYNGAIYWVLNSTIYTMNLSQNQISQVYNSPNLVNPVTINNNYLKYITLSLSNGTLVFYQYTSATTVGTYALTIGDATPTLLSQSKADIDQIIELSF